MKTISLFCCLFLVGFGTISACFYGNIAGVFLAIIGSLAFLVITAQSQKIKEYDANSFMNK